MAKEIIAFSYKGKSVDFEILDRTYDVIRNGIKGTLLRMYRAKRGGIAFEALEYKIKNPNIGFLEPDFLTKRIFLGESKDQVPMERGFWKKTKKKDKE